VRKILPTSHQRLNARMPKHFFLAPLGCRPLKDFGKFANARNKSMANVAIVVGRMKDAVSMQGLIEAATILQTCLATNITILLRLF
jgi:hypothetical protein